MSSYRESRSSRSFLRFLFCLFLLIVFNVYRRNQCFHCQFFPLPFNVSVTGSKIIKEPLPSIQGLSLVTSFWAEKYDAEYKPHAHRREIEAAMLVNLQNPHLRQVVVILDSVNENTTDCQGFVDYMTKKRDNITQSGSSLVSVFASSMMTENKTFPQLECIERRGESSGQPTYYEMFHYATFHPSITSDKVILANADQVFDETVSLAKNLSLNTIFVLGTQGYHPDSVPGHIREQYLNLVGPETGDGNTYNWCFGGEMEKSQSWDAYFYHRSLLKDTLRAHEKFTRLNFWREPMVYYMNELGAEFAALHDVTQDMLGKVSVWNPCHIIRLWHFHLEPKMHHSSKVNLRWPSIFALRGGGYIFYEDYGPVIPRDGKTLESKETLPLEPNSRVPTPSLFAPICTTIQKCFSGEILNATEYHSAPQLDAAKIRITNSTPAL